MRRDPLHRAIFRLPWNARHVGRDVDDELRFHIEMRAEELRAHGLSAADARAEAIRQFGDLEDARRYCQSVDTRSGRRRGRAEWWGAAARDARQAMRGLRRQPGFTLAVVITLALGLGANVTMFGIVDRLLLRPPAHVRSPGELRRIYVSTLEDGTPDIRPEIGYPQLVRLRESMRSASAVGAFFAARLPLGEGEATRQAPVTLASAGFFALLGVQPMLGRFFVADEDVPPVGVRVAVISDELWRREYGGAPDILGKRIVIAGDGYEIVGVAPRGFTGVNLAPVDVWVPIAAAAAEIINGQFVKEPWHVAKDVGWLEAVARYPDAGAAARGPAEATAGLLRAAEDRWSGARGDSVRPRALLRPLLIDRGPDRTPSARIALWLGGMSVVVLLVACANVANLLLARALRRRREIALRVALGAGRGRLVAQLLVEGVMLGALGGIGAVLVAHWGGGVVRRLLLPDVAWGDAMLDPRVLAFATAAALATGLATGLVPARQASAVDLVGALKGGGREGGGRRTRARSALVIGQAALSVLLLSGAGLFLRSLSNARAVDLGFAAGEVLAASPDFIGAGYSIGESLALYDRLRERVASLPGVRAASLGVTQPFATSLDASIALPGRDSLRLPPSGPPRINAIGTDYFATVGTRISQGRAITDGDRVGAPPVTVVNETMARTLWPGRSALGQCVILTEREGRPCLEVVGVARDVQWSDLHADARMQMYTSLAQGLAELPLRVLFVRAAGDLSAVALAVRRETRALAPRVPFVDVQPLARNVDRKLRPWRLAATMFTLFGALALVLAALGLYSVVAYDVAQRTREMGVRMALGARDADVLRLVVGEGVRIAAVGVALGGAVALAAGPWVGPLLFDVAPRDPAVLATVALVLLAVAASACAVPAWRATRVPPGIALRAE